MSYYPTSSPFISTKNNFYVTSLHLPSYYSLKKTPNRRTYTINYTSNINNSISNNNCGKNKNIFHSNIKKYRASPFYNHGKSSRIQEEIDRINKIVNGKSKINKLIEINSMNDFTNNEENENNDLVRNKSKIRLEVLDNISNENYYRNIFKNNRNNNNCYLNYNRKINFPSNLKSRNKMNGLYRKNSIDYYNYKTFMNQMINLKNDVINKWKKEFNSKFNEY